MTRPVVEWGRAGTATEQPTGSAATRAASGCRGEPPGRDGMRTRSSGRAIAATASRLGRESTTTSAPSPTRAATCLADTSSGTRTTARPRAAEAASRRDRDREAALGRPPVAQIGGVEHQEHAVVPVARRENRQHRGVRDGEKVDVRAAEHEIRRERSLPPARDDEGRPVLRDDRSQPRRRRCVHAHERLDLRPHRSGDLSSIAGTASRGVELIAGGRGHRAHEDATALRHRESRRKTNHRRIVDEVHRNEDRLGEAARPGPLEARSGGSRSASRCSTRAR